MKTAVILFNLGGPDNLDAVELFLFNLFYDPAIIRLPKPLRYLVAKLISKKRTPIAQEIYRKIGGSSPILKNTEEQARALEELLTGSRVFTVMRYSNPRSNEMVRQVKSYNPDQIILLPLYPQFSTTTSKSSIDDWNIEAEKIGLKVPTRTLCCYYNEEQFIDAHVDLIRPYYERAKERAPRILFSAHGLPEKIIKSGDPYQWQVERTVESVVAKLGITDLDYNICYQSRVGPLKWIGPSTDQEIMRAGKEGKIIILVPIAFVSEHSETLVELDIEYRKLAVENGALDYLRVPALGTSWYFIEALKSLCLNEYKVIACPKEFSQCLKKCA